MSLQTISDECIKKLVRKCQATVPTSRKSEDSGLPMCPTHHCLLRAKRNTAPRTGVEGELIERAKMPRIHACPQCDYIRVIVPDFTPNPRIVARKLKQFSTRIAEAEKDIEIRPITNVQCPECDNDTALYTSFQMRSADEPETFFYECCGCGHSWRED
jgi:DNA-directed RNA polymerase subunit M/transcription elongation factor TFIIS